MQLHFLLLFVLLVVVRASLVDHDEHYLKEFSNFKTKFGKSYQTEEEHQHRLNIFKTNLDNIEKHNTKSGSSYKQGVNQFTDLTDPEFKSLYLGGYKPLPTPATTATTARYSDRLPDSVDWREKGAVTAVKDQGQCGSCWALATTEVVESHVQIATGTLPVLSPQQVTSCTPNTLHCGGTGGCYGSVCQLGYSYIQLFGITTEDEYPYVSGTTSQTEECSYDLSSMTPMAGITGYNTLPANDQEAVLQHLANVGPLAFAADASIWHRYSGGVFDGCSYDENISINHGIQLVGYGTDEKEGDFWLVRNSWGAGWGEDGYIRLKRDATAQCGVNSTPMDGTACQGGPGNDQQTVCGMCGMLLDVSYPLGAHLIKN